MARSNLISQRSQNNSLKRRESIANHVNNDASEFSEHYDATAPPVGLDMGGHDTFLLGPKIVMLDSFVVDLLNVDTSAQTFRLKLLVNMDWEDDGTIGPEVKAKRGLGRTTTFSDHPGRSSQDSLSTTITNTSHYRTGKYVLKEKFQDSPLSTTWNPEPILVNAIADESLIEAGSKLHSVQMLAGRPVISRSVLYQPECRCAFSFSNFPFDETDLVVKFSSNKWDSEQVNFVWSDRLMSMGRTLDGQRSSLLNVFSAQDTKKESDYLQRSVDQTAIGGVGLSEFEIIKVRVESEEKDVNSLQRYDNATGGFSQAHLIIRVRRDPYSYLLRVAMIAELLMLLEVLSFLTDNSDLSARFSISGTILLAMVGLYGPMADNLPKVSVVTRVDKWHLFNFFLLFLSNVENLFFFMVQDTFNHRVIEYLEYFLGILYLYCVIKALLWFIEPLKEREEWASVIDWIEDTIDPYQEKWKWLIGKRQLRREKPTRRAAMLTFRDPPLKKSWGKVVRSMRNLFKSTSDKPPQRKNVVGGYQSVDKTN